MFFKQIYEAIRRTSVGMTIGSTSDVAHDYEQKRLAKMGSVIEREKIDREEQEIKDRMAEINREYIEEEKARQQKTMHIVVVMMKKIV